jgi:hypothetical protein
MVVVSLAPVFSVSGANLRLTPANLASINVSTTSRGKQTVWRRGLPPKPVRYLASERLVSFLPELNLKSIYTLTCSRASYFARLTAGLFNLGRYPL